jgi:hypothetical protein
MNRKPVSSSSIRSIGYDPDAKILEVELQNGGIYQYFQVPRETHDDLINAASIGRYYSKYVRDSYKYRKVK